MPSKPGSPYNTARYRRERAAFIASAVPVCAWEHCPVPDRLVDVTLSGMNPWGPTIDHRHPTSKGGDMWSGWVLMHRRCNMVKGTKTLTEQRRPRHEW